MLAPIQDLTVERNGDETTERHPAYASIGASRISGSAVLYGSDFNHQHYIRLRISQGYLRRKLSNDWPSSSNRPYIEVDMSEAQWATFISSMDRGEGTQCTLRYLGGEQIAGLPPPASRENQFKSEIKNTLDAAFGELDELAEMIEASSISQKAKAAMRSKLRMSRQQVESNAPFVLDQFGEHMEKTVEAAKVEVNAYVTSATARAGLKQISGADPLLIASKTRHLSDAEIDAHLDAVLKAGTSDLRNYSMAARADMRQAMRNIIESA